MSTVLAIIAVLLASPFLALIGAAIRGIILALPVMWLLAALHKVPELSWIPPLGFWASFGVVALLFLLIPTSTDKSKE